jgi:hypothetical protein
MYLIGNLAKQCLVTFRYDPGDRDLCPLCPRDILITSVDAMTTFKDLCEEVRDMCGLHQQHPLTLKWVDSEGSLGLGMVGLGMVGLSSTGLCTDELVRTNHSSVGTAANGQIGTVQTGQH